MKSTDALLENVKAVEPILAEKLVVKNDGEGSYIFDECCKKNAICETKYFETYTN